MKVGLLCSGNLGYAALKYIQEFYELCFVCTDKGSNSIKELCSTDGILCYVGNPRGGRVLTFIDGIEIDVLVSINYLFLIEEDLISLPKILAFNIHGSLLPKYRGRTPHVWAIINGETETGITAHKIEVGCDTGPIIAQVKIPISDRDTGATILNKYIQEYIPLLDRVLLEVKEGRWVPKVQDEEKATYFGKRTPEDGEIDWEWQKERIKNWVRAQADPYPGAFTWISGEKLIIDEITFSDHGFSQEMPNGLVLRHEPDVLVKVPNGVIKLTKIRGAKSLLINKTILGK
jgi:methionyl-tRNA formyltransferase